MKKFLALLLMFTFAVAPVVGCSSDKKDEKKTEEKKDEKKSEEKKDEAAK